MRWYVPRNEKNMRQCVILNTVDFFNKTVLEVEVENYSNIDSWWFLDGNNFWQWCLLKIADCWCFLNIANYWCFFNIANYWCFFSIANYWCFLNIANCWCFVNTGNCCIISALSKAGKRQRRGFEGKDQQRIAKTVKDWWSGDDDGILMMSRTRDRLWQQNKVTKYGVNHSWTNVQTCWSCLCSFIPFAVLIFGLLMLFC